MRHPHREHRVPEQRDPGEPEQRHQHDNRRPPKVGRPAARRECLDDIVAYPQPGAHQEPGTEERNTPRLIGRCRVRAQHHHHDCPQHQQIRSGEDRVEAYPEDRGIHVACPRDFHPHVARDPVEAADHHADQDHPAREVIEPGSAMHPRTLSSESPQKSGRKQERVHVGITEVGEAERLGRRHSQQEAQEHERIHQRGLQQEVHAKQPGSAIVTTSEQKQARGQRVPDEQGRHIDGVLAVLSMEVTPSPQGQRQGRRHLERGERDERVDGEAHEAAGVRFGLRRRPARPRIASVGTANREHAAERAQVFERPAIGGRGEPRASLPLHLLAQRERVRHVDDEIVVVVVTHRPYLTALKRALYTLGSADSMYY